MSKINVGRVCVDKDRPLRWYVVLALGPGSIWCLVWWEHGEFRAIPLGSMAAKKIRLDTFEVDFPVYQLLARWGITSAQLDAFMEDEVYRWDADVAKVRETRQPLNGRTIEHVRHRHPDPNVGG